MPYAVAGAINAAAADSVLLVLGPFPFGSRLDGATFWFEATDNLSADAGLGTAVDTFNISVATSDRGATSVADFDGVRPVISALPLQSLGSPGQTYFRLSSKSKRDRFILLLVRASNGGAAAFRFGASGDFTSGHSPTAAVMHAGGKFPSSVES